MSYEVSRVLTPSKCSRSHSAAASRVFHPEQPNIPVSGRVLPRLKQVCESTPAALASHPRHVTSPLQLTSLQALQNSLDILRAHRPAYTPRTGFVWPIVEPSSSDSAAKKKAQDGEPALETQEAEGIASARGLAAGDTKRQQNNMLLLHAMRTTAAHAQESFQLPAGPSEETVPETPATATGGRSSVTPAPGPGGTATRAPSIAPTPQEFAKGPPGGGKKKKKRKSRCPLRQPNRTKYPRGLGTATLPPPPA